MGVGGGVRKDSGPLVDWARVARLVLTSRCLDDIEERELLPKGLMFYQFSARGHDLSQVLLGSLLENARDGAAGYYRSRPLLLTLGFGVEDALASAMAKAGGYSDGRDIGAVSNLPSRGQATFLPMAGDVGSQFTPAVGWARAIDYRGRVLGDASWSHAIAVALGGDGSVATNGFWAALNTVTTLSLPYLFVIEDNGYSLSVPATKQTPGGNIARNLASFTGLHIVEGDGTDPADAAAKLRAAVMHVRERRAPALIRLTVPRLCGHSGQDTQAYKTPEFVEQERARDPLAKLRRHLVPAMMPEAKWEALERE
ncbi:MAG: pyruvate dehydrogenase, partial [Planctomycetes bacterium]|nr:pyruvate dehydrogenase [Planctomycetota bacterium]